MNEPIKHCAWIFARGGSKGLPGKNIRPLKGKPLIAWAIEQANDSACFDQVFVSTDDSDIAETAKQFGATVPFFRPAELAQDSSPEWLSWQHAAQWQRDHFPKYQGFTSIPVTSPLREAKDIQHAVNRLAGGFDLVLGVSPSQHHPSFNMVGRKTDDSVQLMMPMASVVSRRQDAEPAYNITTVVYSTSVDHVLNANGVLDGQIGSIIIPPERAADIDTLIDFQWIEFLMDRISNG